MRRRRSTDAGVYPHEGTVARIKCGWCITDDHSDCRVEFVSDLTRATYVCSCECRKDAK